MSLSESEKNRVLDLLDKTSDFERALILASAEAFGRWLMSAAYYLYKKIKEGLIILWNWLVSLF